MEKINTFVQRFLEHDRYLLISHENTQVIQWLRDQQLLLQPGQILCPLYNLQMRERERPGTPDGRLMVCGPEDVEVRGVSGLVQYFLGSESR